MFALSSKTPPSRVPQPERLDEVYEALRRGLQSYLQVHQLELDSLSVQMIECKRNSRLGLLYELDKQVKVIERFMRRLEFHLSKVDELYEAYCMQHRLRDGANKMVKALSSTPSSREARESLTEATKGYREYTESMCQLESELEALMGEFHIKMKGLAGFARLCAGDQYEILMRYGRQRWKLRGRIEVNGRQVWDSEETVFMPLVSDFLSIKVMELKSLASHVVVGNVSCETKDLFTAQPQTVAVDINDLGTVKLSLEVTWNPFDKEDQTSSAGTISKAATVSKRLPSYGQSPPDTPALREHAFSRQLRRPEDVDNSPAWSCSSESSDDSSSPQPSLGTRHTHKAIVQPELHAALPAIHISFTPRDPTTCSHPEEEDEEEEESEASIVSGEEDSGKQMVPNGHTDCQHPLSSNEGMLAKEPPVVLCEASSFPTPQSHPASHETARSADVEPLLESPTESSSATPADCQNDQSSMLYEELSVESQGMAALPPSSLGAEAKVGSPPPEVECCLLGEEPCSNTFETEGVSGTDSAAGHRPASPTTALQTGGTEQTRCHLVVEDSAVHEILNAVLSILGNLLEQFPELQDVEHQLRQLEETLRDRSCSTGLTLTVEDALGSFDFLEEEEEEQDADKGVQEEEEEEQEQWNPVDSEAQGSPCRLEGDEGCKKNYQRASTEPISTGCQALDYALVVHLRNCSSFLQALVSSGTNCGDELNFLDHLQKEVRLLELIRRVTVDTSGHVAAPQCGHGLSYELTHCTARGVVDLERCHGAASLWKQSTDGSTAYITSAQSFLHALAASYKEQLGETCAGITHKVFVRLTERILGHELSWDEDKVACEPLTIFHYWSYLESEGVDSLDTHMHELNKKDWRLLSPLYPLGSQQIALVLWGCCHREVEGFRDQSHSQQMLHWSFCWTWRTKRGS